MNVFANRLCLVTGGAGFIGSHIVERLLMLGSRVRVLDNFSTGRRENILPFAADIQLIDGDICDAECVETALEGVDYVFHQAAMPSVTRSLKEPLQTARVNAEGTAQVLIAAQKARVKRFVYASSSSVYGDTPVLPKREDMPLKPMSPYAASKAAGEYYCIAFFEAYGLPTVILRYFNVFGPRQDPTSEYAAVIPKFITQSLRGETLEIYGDGEQTRDFTYVDDVVLANTYACIHDDAVGKILNIARGCSISVNDLATMIVNSVGSNSPIVHVEARKGEVRHSRADISLAADLLGYKPTIELSEGIARTLRWFSERTLPDKQRNVRQ